jgi:SpoVK/Ycf46/Vps4 family AAA+-type ATPase
MPVPKLLVGPPGVGKTASITKKADYAEVVLLSTMCEEDIAGLPYHNGTKEGRTEPPLFRRLREAAAKGKSTILFLDEIDKARREVADTLLTLVASRKVGEWSLPQGTQIWAAANPPEWGGGDGVSQAMMSRFSIIEYTPDVVEWCAWARSVFPSKEASKAIDMVEAGRAPLMECNGDGWRWRLTCPRTWELALKAATLSTGDERKQVVSGLLTPNAATALLSCFSTAQQGEALARGVAVRAARHSNRTAPLRMAS